MKIYPCREEYQDLSCRECTYTIICDEKDAEFYGVVDEDMDDLLRFDTKQEALDYCAMIGAEVTNG